MARRTKEEAEQTKQALLDTALRLFSERGIAQTTLKDIAADTGVTHGALYWHFSNKSALVKTLYENRRLPLEKLQLEQLQAAHQDSLSALSDFMLQWCMLLHSDPQQAQIWRVFHQGTEQASELDGLRELIAFEHQEWLERIRSFVKKARKQKQIKASSRDKVEAITTHLLAVVCGLINSHFAIPYLIDPNDTFKPVIKTYLKGIRTN